MAHRASLALLALALVALTTAAPIKETVSDCTAMKAAFDTLTGQFENATKPSALSMTLTLNCTADWTGCTDAMTFTPTGPANSTKQPGVKITITSRCKKGENVTIPAAATFITVDTAAIPAKVDVSLEKFIVTGSALSFNADSTSKSTLKTKDLSTDAAASAIVADSLDSVSVSGGSFKASTSESIKLSNITKSVSITKATFSGYNTAAISLDLPANARATVSSNTFMNAGSAADNAVLVTQAGEKINVNLAKTTADNTTDTPICITSPVNVTKATVSVSGSTGITPTKSNRTLTPAGWPVSGTCTVAEFSAA